MIHLFLTVIICKNHCSSLLIFFGGARKASAGGRRGEGAVGGNVTKTPVKSVVQPSID